MTTKKTENKTVLPDLKNWGGVRLVQKRMERSATLEANREAVAFSLLNMAKTCVTDIMEWDSAGNVMVKSSKDIPSHALHAIKKVTSRVDRDGNACIELEMHDKVQVLRLLAKASGLLDSPDTGDRPSVIGINVKAPQIIDAED
jgi:hypothetical protein